MWPQAGDQCGRQHRERDEENRPVDRMRRASAHAGRSMTSAADAVKCGPIAERNPGPSVGATETDFDRSEEPTSELKSLMRISYAVVCLKQKKHSVRNSTSD